MVIFQRLKTVLGCVTVEPVAFLYYGTQCLTDTVRQKLFVSAVCHNLFENATFCDDALSSNGTAKGVVDGEAAFYVTVYTGVEAVFAAVLTILMGPWMDVHGRKWPMLCAAVGAVFATSGYLTLTYFQTEYVQHLWLLLLPSVPAAIGGNFAMISSSTLCYLNDVLNAKSISANLRLVRYVIYEVSLLLGGALGMALGGYLYRTFGFRGVFVAAEVLTVTVVLYIVVNIGNATHSGHDDPESSWFGKITKLPMNMWRSLSLKRGGQLRLILHLMMFVQAAFIALAQMDLTLGYLYIQNKLDWKLDQYTDWKAAVVVTAGVGIVVVAPVLFKHFSALLVVGLACFSFTCYYFLIGSLRSAWWFLAWASIPFTCLGLVPPSVLKTQISRIVKADEIGSIFSILAAIQGLGPLTMTALGSAIFNYALTNHLDTGVMYYGCALAVTITGAIALCTDILWKKNSFLLTGHGSHPDPTSNFENHTSQ